MPTMQEILKLIEVSDKVSVKFLYKKEAEDARRILVAAGYDCRITPKEFSNRNSIYYLTVKKQVL